jgi:hypothetical protein
MKFIFYYKNLVLLKIVHLEKLLITFITFFSIFNFTSIQEVKGTEDNSLESSSKGEGKSIKNYQVSKLIWEPINKSHAKNHKWEKIKNNDYELLKNSFNESHLNDDKFINSFNRSVVFDNSIVGPDIGWLVPPGFSWSNNHTFDFSIRGHNRRKIGEQFLGWNGGDAVSQIYLQPIHTEKSSYGINIGVRSVYQGNALGGKSSIGEGLSMGFRYDRELSSTSGMAIGAEQLIHLDNKTDTGRDLYVTFSKGWWKNKDSNYPFPLYTATAGLATGKMAEGTLYGLCSNLFGGSGTETRAQRPLCWAPVFSLAKVFNESFSTFFEYNSYWFLLGTSYAPFKSVPLRGTFAVQISDHINNYKVNNFENLKWVFRLSLGF